MRGKWKIKRSNVDKSTLKSLGGKARDRRRKMEGGREMDVYINNDILSTS